jgi:serine/threonine protein kinase
LQIVEPQQNPNQISKRDAESLSSLADQYVVRSVLGHGASSTVFLAEDADLGRLAVLKLLNADDKEAVSLFQKEAKLTISLDHPNIVKVMSLGVTRDDRPYFITEYVEGRTVGAILASSGPLNRSQSLEVAIGVSDALAYCHNLGVVHRDLKPTNVLIPGWPDAPEFKKAKILDFGVAGRLDHGRTQAGMVFGTPRYMSPEQITGEAQTPATDIYGLGLLLFEMLIGHAPASRLKDTWELIRTIVGGLPAEELEGLDPNLASLIRRCISRKPEERPSIKEVITDLKRIAALGKAGVQRAELEEIWSVGFTLPAASSESLDRPHRPAAAGSSTGEFTRGFRVPEPPRAPAAESTTLILNVPEPLLAPVSTPKPIAEPKTVEAPRRRRLNQPALLITALGLVALAIALIYRFAASPSQESVRILEFVGGLLVMGTSIALGFWLRGWLGSNSSAKTQAVDLLFGAKSRVDLTATIALQLDELVGRLRALDERILASTVALMLNEYGRATDAKDRQAALMNVVALSEKLAVRLSPWYERYKEVIASAVAVMGGVSGLVTAINSVLGSHKH